MRCQCLLFYQIHLFAAFFNFGNAEPGLRNRTYEPVQNNTLEQNRTYEPVQNNTSEQRNFIRPSGHSSTNSNAQLFGDNGSDVGGKKGELDLSHFDIESIVTLSRIEVQIFSDSSVLVFDRKYATEESWYGEATSETDAGSMNLLVSDGEITGSLNAGGTIFSINTQPGGTVSVLAVDERNYPSETEPLEQDYFVQSVDLDLASSGFEENTDTDIIDIICLYSHRAMCAEVGKPYPCSDERINRVNRRPMNRRCQAAVQETNRAFALSGVHLEINLVFAGPIEDDYDEYLDPASFCDVLTQLTVKNDGYMDYIHDLRNQHRADLVSFVIERRDSCGCGWGYTDQQYYGLSVVSRVCMTGYYSFGHEIGHNLGCNHQQRNPDNEWYGYGYNDPDSRFRSIMSVNCASRCKRVQRFSNNHTQYQHQKDKYAPIGASNIDCARAINENGPQVAKFRNSVAEPPSSAPGSFCSTDDDCFSKKCRKRKCST